MSDTSIISTTSSYKKHHLKNLNDYDEHSSCCARYWFSIINTFLLFIIVITSALLIYFLNKQAERDRERQRIKDEFKRKHGVTNKVLDMIMKHGIVYKWIQAHKGSVATTFKELFKDITQTIFDE
jgi:hypothetical protein